MTRSGFVFEGLVEIEGRIRRLSEEVGYLAISDRTDRNNEEQLGRFDFVMKDALPYLGQSADNREPEDEEGDVFDADAFEDASDEEGDEESEANTDLASIAEAGCRWLRDIAQRNTVGESYRRFRVKAYSHKGLRVIDTASFVCKNVDADLDLPARSVAVPEVPSIPMPVPQFEEVAERGSLRGFRALGDYYAQFGQLVIGSASQQQGIYSAMLAQLHKQLQDSREQVEQLIASILEFRVTELKTAGEQRADERNESQRTELAKQALAQLGEMAKALLVTKGIPAELADAIGPISQNQNLVSALSDPDVRTLLEEPQNLDMIAGMLRQAGQQARALREATAQNS